MSVDSLALSQDTEPRMQLSEFDFELPPEYIAQHPVTPRDHSRLLVVHPSALDHCHVYDLPNYLNPGDMVVLNNTRVINARLMGRRSTGATIEIMLIERRDDGDWLALIRPAKRVENGECITVHPTVSVTIIEKNCVAIDSHSAPLHRVRLVTELPWDEALTVAGQLPLPPYIRRPVNHEADTDRYQTIVATSPGAVAAPTAGLHFTEELMFNLRQKGVSIETITLHVGIGTFKPISVEDISQHRMHEEYYCVSESTARAINQAKSKGGRVVAVGTTVIRCLESASTNGQLRAGDGRTSIFIRPGYRWQLVDGLVTNFHLPKSSLMVLVSAMAGMDRIRSAYQAAIANRYRFFSYGDAMLIWANSSDD